jgi:hypothetical protein
MFWVTYDLIQVKDYRRLKTRLTQLGAKQVLLSVWALKGDYTAPSLRDDLQRHVDHDDRVLVVENRDWASFNALLDANTV